MGRLLRDVLAFNNVSVGLGAADSTTGAGGAGSGARRSLLIDAALGAKEGTTDGRLTDDIEGVREGVTDEGTVEDGKELAGGVCPAFLPSPRALLLLIVDEGLPVSVPVDVTLDVILGVLLTLGGGAWGAGTGVDADGIAFMVADVLVVVVEADVCLLERLGATGDTNSSSGME